MLLVDTYLPSECLYGDNLNVGGGEASDFCDEFEDGDELDDQES